MEVNLLAVVVAGVINFAVGAGWYMGWAKPWMDLNGFTDETMKESQGRMGMTYGVTMLTSLVMAYVLGNFIVMLGVMSFMEGLQVGFWAWVGFVACTFVPNYLFGNRSLKLLMIDSLYYLVSLPIMGGLLGIWR